VTAQRLKAKQSKSGEQPSAEVDQLDFEFVLFASAVIDYDYIMGLMEKFSQQAPGRSKMTHEQLIGLIESDAKFMDDREDISQYVGSLKAGAGLDKKNDRRRLPAIQGRESGDRACRHCRQAWSGDRVATKLCRQHPAADDF